MLFFSIIMDSWGTEQNRFVLIATWKQGLMLCDHRYTYPAKVTSIFCPSQLPSRFYRSLLSNCSTFSSLYKTARYRKISRDGDGRLFLYDRRMKNFSYTRNHPFTTTPRRRRAIKICYKIVVLTLHVLHFFVLWRWSAVTKSNPTPE